jgi:hypothetical protein
MSSNLGGLTFPTHNKALKHYWIWFFKWCISLFKGLNN